MLLDASGCFCMLLHAFACFWNAFWSSFSESFLTESLRCVHRFGPIFEINDTNTRSAAGSTRGGGRAAETRAGVEPTELQLRVRTLSLRIFQTLSLRASLSLRSTTCLSAYRSCSRYPPLLVIYAVHSDRVPVVADLHADRPGQTPGR